MTIIIKSYHLRVIFFRQALPSLPKSFVDRCGRYHTYQWIDTKFAPHFLDAFTNALGVASTFLMYGRFGQEFMLYLVKGAIGIFMWSGLFHSDILSFDFSMIFCMAAYAISGGAGLWVWMDATPTGRNVKSHIPFLNYTK